MTYRFSEAEVNSCTKNFLLKNNFNFLSTKGNGEKFYYRIEESIPPSYKQPDCLVFKDNIVLIFEEKIKYSDLFKKNNLGVSDIDKLRFFLNSKPLKLEFLHQVGPVIGVHLDDINLIAGVNSLKCSPNIQIKYPLPADFLHLETNEINENMETGIINLPKSIENLFHLRTCTHIL